MKTLAQSLFSVEAPTDLFSFSPKRTLYEYRSEVAENRKFFLDSVANAIISRIIDVAATPIYNRKNNTTEEEFAYFNLIAKRASDILKEALLEYLLSGLSVPDYILERVVGNRIHPEFGRKRIYTPPAFFVRDPMTLIIERHPFLNERILYVELPKEEIDLVKNKGVYENGVLNPQPYEIYATNFPQYVALIERGITRIMLQDRSYMFRQPTSYDPYPRPYLTPAIPSLKHKAMLKQMDYQTAKRAQEAILHVKAGNDTYPVEEGDNTLEQIAEQIRNRPNVSVYRLYTNHTVELKWVYPPLDALLSKDKYEEPNADIFLSLGFSRALLVGESFRSNSGNLSITNLGPLAIIQDTRAAFIQWLSSTYQRLASVNGFDNVAVPKFVPIRTSDFIALINMALAAVNQQILSKETVAAMFGSVYNEEFLQINEEFELTREEQNEY